MSGARGGERAGLACRLAPDLLVVLREGPPPSPAVDWRVGVARDGGLRELNARVLPLSVADAEPRAWLLTIGAFDGGLDELLLLGGDQRLALVAGPEAVTLCEPAELAAAVRELGFSDRGRALEFLSSAPPAHGIAPSARLSAGLAAACESLREPLPRTEIAPEATCVLRLERVGAIDRRAFWLSGWICDAAPEQASLTAVTPEGVSVELAPGCVSFHERADVASAVDSPSLASVGFHAYVELEYESRHPDGWVLELRSAGGAIVEDVARNPVGHDHHELRPRILDPLRTSSPDDRIIGRQVLPALERLRAAEPPEIKEVRDYGPVAEVPDVSVVIATTRVELIAHQLLGFTAGTHSAGTELIFVVPPGIGAAVDRQAGELTDLYRVGCRVAILSGDTRAAAAVNLGASLARGRLLVLQRDDVFATAPGWLDALGAFHDGTRAAAAVGPKLVYEDGAIAHLGTTYRPAPRAPRWEATYPLRGLARGVDGAREPRQVQALSDGCVMISTALFHARGGLCESYLDGGDEVADLCLALAEDGLQAWCTPDVELTFLDHGGWPTRSSPATRRFNDWLLNWRWGAQLAGTSGEAVAGERRPRRAGSAPRSGSGRAGAPVEIVEVNRTPIADWLLDAALTHPGSAEQLDAYAGTHSLAIEGWAVADGGEALRVEIHDRRGPLGQAPVSIGRRDVARRFPDAPGAQAAGFGTVIGTIGLATEFQLEVEVVREDGERCGLATIHGHRRPLRSAFAPTLQPLLITTLGRTGSSWLELLVAQHPEIVACRPFVHDARLTSYWTQVLRTLAEPASYLQILRPELYPGLWWTGEHRPGLLPLRMAETHMANWLGADGVEVAAGFCQTRIEDFYAELARVESRPSARYFAEKCWPDEFTPRIVGELYPEAREILLVRDFRDMVCSILGFNAKRGTASFGREAADNDEQFIRDLRDSALQMRDSWRARREQAHLIRYEDLILEPETTLGAAFAYLGVAADAAVVGEAIAAAEMQLPEAQREHRTSDSPVASIGRWKHELSAEHRALCDEAFGDVLADFDYEPTGPAGPAGPDGATPRSETSRRP